MRLLLVALTAVSLVAGSDSNHIRRLAAPICGDGKCEGEETCSTCPDDCGCVKTRDLYNTYTYSTCSNGGQVCTSDSDCYFPNTCNPTNNPPPPFSFLGVADTPYNHYEACMARQEVLRLDPNADYSFFFHLGDIRNGQPDKDGSYTRYCDESLFEDINKIWRGVPYPTFFIPGDNGWLDCPEPYGYRYPGSLPAPERAYELWKQYLFFFYEQGKPKLPPGTQVLRGVSEDAEGLGYVPAKREARLYEDRSELFSFYLEENKALVIGTSTPGVGREESRWNPDPWTMYRFGEDPKYRLEKDNRRWINYNVHKYLPSVVIILAHSIEPDHNAGVGDMLKKMAEKFPAVPFLVLMDDHCFKEMSVFWNAPNIYRIRLDDTSTPIEINVDLSQYDPDDMEKVFQYDRGCYCHTDHKPTRKICWGESWGSSQCHKKCSDMESRCGGKDTGPFYGGNYDWCGCPSGAECCSYGDNVCGWYNSCSFY